ncbi:hypothetical protein OIU34_37380 [Pararhizobium sp. BT-229]|uniref:hypothetical protein n=1 Tax=Pararhizobium sp. BT-229 TaxID=2986923 RepID=UPI0021F79F28|nr:hypothetical protein [Pararhizobium sp. BT-229]MCV9967500.1 hypothetical protein [Pararhizobium sp. BT-229]
MLKRIIARHGEGHLFDLGRNHRQSGFHQRVFGVGRVESRPRLEKGRVARTRRQLEAAAECHFKRNYRSVLAVFVSAVPPLSLPLLVPSLMP